MAAVNQDEKFMMQALQLAQQGTALSSPGARVGAVVVDREGMVAGTGFYAYDGLQHAEALALKQAGRRAQGGTLYVTLEPCSHHGRTPPCTDQVIAAGVSRVVAAISDPNPKVEGKGLSRLSAAGIQVETGLFGREARRLNENFARYILNARPLVIVKSAMTLDGKIAAAPSPTNGARSATFITGPEARAHVQELRHEADAILVGVGTVLADDPLLTDRTGRPRRRPLLRVILDSQLRLPLESQLVATAANDVVVFCSRPAENKGRELGARGVRVEQVMPCNADGRPGLRLVLERLGEMEITSLLIEGGAQVNGAALAAGIIDKVFFYYAATVLGDKRSVAFSSGFNPVDPVRVSNVALHQFGKDVAVEGYLRDPYVPLVDAETNKLKVGERA